MMNRPYIRIVTTVVIAATTLLVDCGGKPNPIVTRPPHVSGWTWVSGSNNVLQAGVYGTQGTPSPTNVPGARNFGVSWTDHKGNLWMFAGQGLDSNGATGELNDLWEFDGTKWTWVSGANFINQAGVYGTQGTPTLSNVPGARDSSAAWIDSQGNLWLLGGNGYDSKGVKGWLNDLWKFDGKNWTWVSGSDTSYHLGVYGVLGVASPSNMPGTRLGSASWIDSQDNLWLFGGYGYDSIGPLFGQGFGELGDLWKFDGANWAWMGGWNTRNHSGQYGTQGVPDSTNMPGTRDSSVTWVDKSGSLWLFGGYGLDYSLGWSNLNDVWKFDGSNWAWMGGSYMVDQPGVYGTRGVSQPANIPGARDCAAWSTDSAGNLWLFGGFSYFDYNSFTQYEFNDLWKFDGTGWTWVSGGGSTNQTGQYGTRGTPSQSNTPGARGGQVGWIDSEGTFWVFGGYSVDASGTEDLMNDLWLYEP